MGHWFRQTAATVSLAWIVAIGGVAQACCPAWKIGSPITIADQKILVIWDPDTKTEHFIRAAGFRGSPRRDEGQANDAAGFGFLVPSPAQPEVAAADAEVFTALDDAIRPKVVVVDRWRADPMPLLLKPFLLAEKVASRAAPTDAAPMSEVRVLERKQVGQYDVAVLQADDARALTEWLAGNGFDSRPALEEWARPYVEKGWIITAFRYAENTGRVETGAVRMSFKTEVPMFAYRVPTDNIANADEGQPPSLLRAFVVLPGRANGTLGEGEQARGWEQALCRYSRPLADEGLRGLLGRTVGADATVPATAWLTAFDDRTWPSGTEDLRFTYQPDGSEYQEVDRRFRDRSIPLPLDVIGVAIAAAAWGVKRRLAT